MITALLIITILISFSIADEFSLNERPAYFINVIDGKDCKTGENSESYRTSNYVQVLTNLANRAQLSMKDLYDSLVVLNFEYNETQTYFDESTCKPGTKKVPNPDYYRCTASKCYSDYGSVYYDRSESDCRSFYTGTWTCTKRDLRDSIYKNVRFCDYATIRKTFLLPILPRKNDVNNKRVVAFPKKNNSCSFIVEIQLDSPSDEKLYNRYIDEIVEAVRQIEEREVLDTKAKEDYAKCKEFYVDSLWRPSVTESPNYQYCYEMTYERAVELGLQKR
jgi:hypothetical protein